MRDDDDDGLYEWPWLFESSLDDIDDDDDDGGDDGDENDWVDVLKLLYSQSLSANCCFCRSMSEVKGDDAKTIYLWPGLNCPIDVSLRWIGQ